MLLMIGFLKKYVNEYFPLYAKIQRMPKRRASPKRIKG